MHPAMMLRSAAFFGLCLTVLLFEQLPGSSKPQPDIQNAKYGPHERNVLDLWKAVSEGPAPLLVYIHGGGFLSGDKTEIPAQLLKICLQEGISVAAINYRLSQHAPFPAPMLDSARAIQFLRLHAQEWNLDPKRIAATGTSAGAGIALWIGFHDDLADPKADDPVARQSTRLACMVGVGAQTSYDPRFIKDLIGGRAHEHPALSKLFGLSPDELDSPRAHKLYEEASPINYVTADDPPVFLLYQEPRDPLPASARAGDGIHHPTFGVALQAKLDPLGIECVLRHQDDYKAPPPAAVQMNREMLAFLVKHLKAKDQDKPG
jgi:acetyl esterase/lipase